MAILDMRNLKKVTSFILSFGLLWIVTVVTSLPLWVIEGIGWLYIIAIFSVFDTCKSVLCIVNRTTCFSHLFGLMLFLGVKLAVCEWLYSYIGLFLLICTFSILLQSIMSAFQILPRLYMNTIFIVSNSGIMITLLPVTSIIEFIIELHFFPILKTLYPIAAAGMVMVICGQVMWWTTCITVAKIEGNQLQLITRSLYYFFRHPSYIAYFFWYVGLQLLLCNPVSTIVHVWLYWRLYDEKIPYEEECLVAPKNMLSRFTKVTCKKTFNILVEEGQSRPDSLGDISIVDFYQATLPIAVKWKKLGLALGIEQTTLDSIKKVVSIGKFTQEEQMRKALWRVLNVWIIKKQPTWMDLVSAMQQVDHEELAVEIARSHYLDLAEGANTSEGSNALKKPDMVTLTSFQGKTRIINIAAEIGIQYIVVGTALLQDHSGSVIPTITRQYRDNPVEINMEILRRWIQGGGMEDHSWQGLIDVLRNSRLNALADDIEEVKGLRDSSLNALSDDIEGVKGQK